MKTPTRKTPAPQAPAPEIVSARAIDLDDCGDHPEAPAVLESVRLDVLAPPGTPLYLQEILLARLDAADFRDLLAQEAAKLVRRLGLADCHVRQS